MKTYLALFSLLLAAPAFVQAAKTTDPAVAKAAVVPALQMKVTAPVSFRPFVSDDVAEAFGYRVAEALRQQGFKAPVKYLDSFDPVVKDVALLEVNLFEWRRDRIGNIECTFAATLTTPAGKKDLGLFTGTSMTMFSRQSWFQLADHYEDAARDAMSGLYKRIQETNLTALPDAA